MLARFICILGFCLWSGALTIKYYHFGYYDWDLALYSQAMWGLCHGTTNVSLFGTSFLADHAHYIAFLITPIYFIFHHPLTLVYLNVLSFFIGAYFLYKLAEKLTSKNTAFILFIVYLFHPANIFMLMYEFHFESLAISFIFLLFYFQLMEKYRAFMITAILLMLIKENMPLIVFMMGVYGLVFKPAGRIKWGLVPLLLGGGMFILTMFVLTPIVRANLPTHQSIYWGQYFPPANDQKDILTSLSLNFCTLIKRLFFWKNLYFIQDILGGFVCGAIFSPAILLVGTPIYLQNLLSNAPGQHTIFFHYTATWLPFVSVAAAYGFALLKKRYPTWLNRLFLSFCVMITCISFIHYLPRMQIRMNLSINKYADLRQTLIDKIPADAGVVASCLFLSHLCERRDLYAFYNVWMDINYFTGQQPFIVPSRVHYALIDFYEPFLLGYINHPEVQLNIKNFLSQSGWKVKYAKSGIVLYER